MEASLKYFAAAAEQAFNRLILLPIAICLILQAWLILVLEINWDEFLYLSQIYDYQRGELTRVVQVLHVHLFGWIIHLPGNEVDQVLVGRMVMFACVAGTCALIYSLSREFFGQVAAMIAVLAFVSAGPTLIHGSSFRTDPIAAFFIMLSLTVLARGKKSALAMLVAGASAAVAAMITVKVILYAPAFLGIAAWRLRDKEDRKQALKWLAGTAVVAGVSFAALYLMQLWLVEKASNDGSRAVLSNAAQIQFFSGFIPQRSAIVRAAMLSPVQVILLLAGTIGVLIALLGRSGNERFRSVAVAGCGATLLCLLFYRNAFPYFFAFIIPPAMLLVAWTVEWSGLLKSRTGAAVLAAAMLGSAVLVAKAWAERELPPQRQVVAAVHEIFPDPVLMIDHSHMVGSFPKRGFFMSTWGMANYRQHPPIFARILQQETIPLLLLDSPRLAEAVGVRPAMDPSDRLHELDRAVLRDNFVSHWGPIWVAGKRIRPEGPDGFFDIAIPGTYTLEGDGLAIDAREIPSGGVVRLARGQHHFEANSQTSRTLRWGDHLERPTGPEPSGPLFVGF